MWGRGLSEQREKGALGKCRERESYWSDLGVKELT